MKATQNWHALCSSKGMRNGLGCSLLLLAFLIPQGALAQEPAPQPGEPALEPGVDKATETETDREVLAAEPPSDTTARKVVPPKARERKTNLQPKAAEPGAAPRAMFQSDPIADGCIVLVSLGSAGVLELINSTGEIRPQQIADGFKNSQLISIDRAAVTQTADPSAGPRSNLGLGVAAAFAVLDPVFSSVREQSAQAGLVDAIMYAETASLTLALTNLVKMAVRRPRPLAYTAAEAHKNDATPYSNSSTDSALSFFSGHSSMTGAIGATATYLAFARSPGKVRPWVTLSFFTALTTFVSYERVRAGKHFPTDVIAGAFAGMGIGIVVPHLHRAESVKQRPVWVGFEPALDRNGETQGGALTLTGLF